MSSDRESPAMSESSGTSSMTYASRSTTPTVTPPQGTNNYSTEPQTVTTKVMATAKLKVEVHGPFMDRECYSCSSSCSNSSRPNSRSREQNKRHSCSRNSNSDSNSRKSPC